MSTRPNVPLAELPRAVAETLSRRGAQQLNLYRALASSPALVQAWLRFLWDVRDGCRTARSLREIAILRTAVRSGSEYEWVHHVLMARAAGLREEQIAAVKEWEGAHHVFGEHELLALRLTDAIVDGSVPDDLVAESLEGFGAEGHVELVVTIATYVMVPRVLDALRVPLEEGLSANGESVV